MISYARRYRWTIVFIVLFACTLFFWGAAYGIAVAIAGATAGLLATLKT